MSEAVKCWIKSIVAMKMLNRVSMWEPFLYLAGVAKALSSETHFGNLMARVNEISPHGELSLEDKRKVWITRFAVIIIALTLILFFLQFLKSSEQEPATSVPQVSKKPTVVEPEKDKGVEPAIDPVRNKGNQGPLGQLLICFFRFSFTNFLHDGSQTEQDSGKVSPVLKKNGISLCFSRYFPTSLDNLTSSSTMEMEKLSEI